MLYSESDIKSFLGLMKYKHELYDIALVDLHSSHYKIEEGNFYNFSVIFRLFFCHKTITELGRCPVDTNIVCHYSGFTKT